MDNMVKETVSSPNMFFRAKQIPFMPVDLKLFHMEVIDQKFAIFKDNY